MTDAESSLDALPHASGALERERPPAVPEPRLTETESTVLRALTDRESAAAFPRVADAYRRLAILARSTDPIDGILAAHLAREVLSALPGTLGVALASGRLEYENRLQDLAGHWPLEARDGAPPTRVVTGLRQLLEDHELASGRAREGPRALLTREDRARTGFVPDTSLVRWTDLARRGADLAHRLRNHKRELPRHEDTRRLVDEVTATLLAVIAPYFEGIGELDRLLAAEHPGEQEAQYLVALLRTASQHGYFFERADERWLSPLANVGGFLTTPPALVDVGGGYVQAPYWPQGRFLARVAASAPDLVARLVRRVPRTDNPRAIATLVEILRALPADVAAPLARDVANRLSVPLAVDYAAVEASALAGELGRAGHVSTGVDLLIAVVSAAIASPRDEAWFLEQALGDPLDALAGADDTLARRLRTCLRRLVRAQGRARRYSTMWLRNVDRRPRYGADAAWFIANALYRSLLVMPLPAAQALVADLLADRERVLARVALAAIADRPDAVANGHEDLLASAGWDDESSTRYEFRRALGALWARSSAAGKGALLEYAEEANEVDEIVERLARDGIAHDSDDLRHRWRSRLLSRIRDQLPADWLERNGPLEAVEDERIPEPTAEWIGTPSPISEADLSALRPEELMRTLQGWEEPTSPSFGEAGIEGLGQATAAVMLGRLADYVTVAGDAGRLAPALVSQIVSALDRALREGHLGDRDAGTSFMLELAEVFVARPETGMWAREARRSIASFLSLAANEGLLSEADGERALTVLRVLLADAEPTPEFEEQDLANGYDAGALALNSVRGEATTATIELLLAARRLEWGPIHEGTSELLRHVARTDRALAVKAAMGLRLPWLLARDPDHQDEWLALLFGETVAASARKATWEAYLLYSRFFSDTATLLAREYQAAVMALEPRPQEERGRPRDEDEQLGTHVAMAHLLALPVEEEGRWLREFFARAAGWLRGRVTRWIAEQAASDNVGEEVRARARAFLAERVEVADPDADREELKAISWVSAASDHGREVVRALLLPALEKTRGETENEAGAARLAARLSTDDPQSAARLLQLLVAGDPWRSLPHVAGAELREALEQLIGGADDEARVVAEDVINTLGAQGFLEYRDLLGRTD